MLYKSYQISLKNEISQEMRSDGNPRHISNDVAFMLLNCVHKSFYISSYHIYYKAGDPQPFCLVSAL
jgi:hypothetical protein